MKFEKAIPYDILIRATPNGGFEVEVGCVNVVYMSWTNLIRDLSEYFENPKEVEKQYNEYIVCLGSINIGRVPDIQVRPYGTGKTASEISMLASNMAEKQKEFERELNVNPKIVIHHHKEPES